MHLSKEYCILLCIASFFPNPMSSNAFNVNRAVKKAKDSPKVSTVCVRAKCIHQCSFNNIFLLIDFLLSIICQVAQRK